MEVEVHIANGDVIVKSSLPEAFKYAENNDEVFKITVLGSNLIEDICFVRNLRLWRHQIIPIHNPNQGEFDYVSMP